MVEESTTKPAETTKPVVTEPSTTVHTHKTTTVTVDPSCETPGMKYDVCSECGEKIGKETVIPATGHVAGDWETAEEPTVGAEGKKVKKCTVCEKILEEAAIPKLKAVTDEKTNISLEYPSENYDGEVSITVEESFDGSAINIVNTQTGSATTMIFDITMTVDGKETQPNGKVTVRIPLPEGYNPNRSFVYHVSTETGKAVKMNSRHENGYLVFETDHFSYYAVVDETESGTADATLSIKTPSTTTVKYGDTLILHAEIKGELPDGAKVEWSVEGSGVTIKPSDDGKTCAVTSTATGDVTITAKYVDANGVEHISEQEIESNAGFWQKIVSFFKNLFGINRIIEQKIKF